MWFEVVPPDFASFSRRSTAFWAIVLYGSRVRTFLYEDRAFFTFPSSEYARARRHNASRSSDSVWRIVSFRDFASAQSPLRAAWTACWASWDMTCSQDEY
mgnify:CR=1 FL=1